MKSFKEYLTESKKVYEFKLIMCGELPKNTQSAIKSALAQFDVASVSDGRRKPIAEMHTEFPEHKNTEITFFDVTTNYPVNAPQVRDLVAHGLGLPLSHIKAKTLNEWNEWDINHEHDKSTGKAVGGTKQEPSDHSDLMGEKQMMSFLQELSKAERHTGTQYKGVNDEILAAGAPKHSKETPGKQVKVETKKFANIFTKQVKITDPMKGAK